MSWYEASSGAGWSETGIVLYYQHFCCIPCVHARTHTHTHRLMRAIALATTREIHSGEELLSSYLTVVSD